MGDRVGRYSHVGISTGLLMIFTGEDFTIERLCISWVLWDGMSRYRVKTVFIDELHDWETHDGIPMTALVQGF